jgi:hypothetical protein
MHKDKTELLPLRLSQIPQIQRLAHSSPRFDPQFAMVFRKSALTAAAATAIGALLQFEAASGACKELRVSEILLIPTRRAARPPSRRKNFIARELFKVPDYLVFWVALAFA